MRSARKRSVITPFAMAVVLAASVAGSQTTPTRERRAETPRSVRLYVFDCGTLHIADMTRFRLTAEEVATTDLSVPCFLVAHPKGTLLWELASSLTRPGSPPALRSSTVSCCPAVPNGT